MTRTFKNLIRLGGTVAVTAYIATGLAAGFSISRIAVTFDEMKPPAIVERNSDVSVQAEVSFSGNGLVKGAWEVAGPNPDGSNPQYRTLVNVNQYLAGKDSAILKGPKLPTESTGPYLVRLRIIDPVPAFDTPVATYNVLESKRK
jgi:hypothetical protein